MKQTGVVAVALTIGAAAVLAWSGSPVHAQSAQATLKQSCADARRAFSLRDAATEKLAVADPGAAAQLRQAALLFYRCGQRQDDPYMHDLFLAYYASTLYKVGQTVHDNRAISIAVHTAQTLRSSDFDDVKALVANISPPSPAPSRAIPTVTPAPATPSTAYCLDVAPNMVRTLDALGNALVAANDAGTNDTQVIATTTARYGSAFKAVEDDFNTAQSSLQTASAAFADASGATANLTDQEKTAVTRTLQTISQTMSYTDTYSRLAVGFERGVSGANRRLAWARVSQAFTSGMRNTSYTYTNGNASCYSYTPYTANCYGNSYSTTTYDNSATIAPQNAANALARAGRPTIVCGSWLRSRSRSAATTTDRDCGLRRSNTLG